MNFKETFGHKLGPLPVWAWALIGGAGMWLLLHKKAGAQPSTNGATGQAVYGAGDFMGAGGGSGGGGGGVPPPTPPPPTGTPPSIPYAPPVVLGSSGTPLVGYGGPTVTGNGSVYTLYNTPSGGPPSYTNPAPEMAGWTPADWQAYAASLAHEWGGSVEQYLDNLGVPGYTYWSANQSQSQLSPAASGGSAAAGAVSGAGALTGQTTSGGFNLGRVTV